VLRGERDVSPTQIAFSHDGSLVAAVSDDSDGLVVA
jgi:hypothetical protein